MRWCIVYLMSCWDKLDVTVQYGMFMKRELGVEWRSVKWERYTTLVFIGFFFV
jgi:hypothetical protein